MRVVTFTSAIAFAAFLLPACGNQSPVTQSVPAAPLAVGASAPTATLKPNGIATVPPLGFAFEARRSSHAPTGIRTQQQAHAVFGRCKLAPQHGLSDRAGLTTVKLSYACTVWAFG